MEKTVKIISVVYKTNEFSKKACKNDRFFWTNDFLEQNFIKLCLFTEQTNFLEKKPIEKRDHCFTKQAILLNVRSFRKRTKQMENER